MRKPNETACAMTSVSKTKSFEFRRNGMVFRSCLPYARYPVCSSADQLRDERAVVLAVRVQHDDDIGILPEGLHIAGLLIAAVADVVRVTDDIEGQGPRELRCAIPRPVIDEDHLVDPGFGDLLPAV